MSIGEPLPEHFFNLVRLADIIHSGNTGMVGDIPIIVICTLTMHTTLHIQEVTPEHISLDHTGIITIINLKIRKKNLKIRKNECVNFIFYLGNA